MLMLMFIYTLKDDKIYKAGSKSIYSTKDMRRDGKPDALVQSNCKQKETRQ